MKKNIFILFIFFNFSSFAQKSNLIKQLDSFVPKGFAIKDTAFGDLNKDTKMDVALVLYTTKEDESDFQDTAMNIGRPLLILLQQQNGQLKQVKRNDSMIMCKTCGGMMGDPFQGITIKNNMFTLDFYGGSSSRWGDSYGFSWSASKQTWQLTKEEHLSLEIGNPEETTKETKVPASEIDHLTIDNFNINHLYEQAEVKGKIIAGKCYFYNAPSLTTKRKAYVMKGDIVSISREYKTFYDVFFENAQGQMTSGYILKKDVQKLR